MKTIAIIALTLLAACTRTMEGRQLSTTGNQVLFDDAAIARIVEGKSTKADVRATLGEPTHVSFVQEGSETWTYVAATSRMQTMTVGMGGYSGGQTEFDNRTATVLFSADGVVRKFGTGRSRSCGGPGGAPISCP